MSVNLPFTVTGVDFTSVLFSWHFAISLAAGLATGLSLAK